MQGKLKIPVGEFTSPSPVTVSEETGVESILELMESRSCRHVPVLKNNRVTGVISDRDIYKNYKKMTGEPSCTAKDIMTREVYRVTERADIDKVVFAMSDRKISSAIIEDSEHSFVGIFTSTDALNALVEVVRGEYEESMN